MSFRIFKLIKLKCDFSKYYKLNKTSKGHHQWVMNSYPDDPMVELDLETGVILFEDGTSLTAGQHQMTEDALISLADLLK